MLNIVIFIFCFFLSSAALAADDSSFREAFALKFNLAAEYSRSNSIEKAYEQLEGLKAEIKSNNIDIISLVDSHITELKKAKSKNEPMTHHKLAMLYYIKSLEMPKGRKALRLESIKELDQLLKIKPNDIWSINYKGLLHYQTNKDYAEALKYWQEARRIDKEHPLSYFLEGKVLMSESKASEGLALISKALVLRAKNEMATANSPNTVNTTFTKN